MGATELASEKLRSKLLVAERSWVGPNVGIPVTNPNRDTKLRSRRPLFVFDTDATHALGRLSGATWKDFLRCMGSHTAAWSPWALRELLGTNLRRKLTRKGLLDQQRAMWRYWRLARKRVVGSYEQLFWGSVFSAALERIPARQLRSGDPRMYSQHVKRFLRIRRIDQIRRVGDDEIAGVGLFDADRKFGRELLVPHGFPEYSDRIRDETEKLFGSTVEAKGRKMAAQAELTACVFSLLFMRKCEVLGIARDVAERAWIAVGAEPPAWLHGLLLEAHFHAKRYLGLTRLNDENTGRDLRLAESLAWSRFIVTEDRSFRARANEVFLNVRFLSLSEAIDIVTSVRPASSVARARYTGKK